MPTESSKNSLNKWKRKAIEHVSLHGITTHRALKRVVFGSDGALANRVVRTLIEENTLFRHGSVLSQSKRRPTAGSLHRDHAVLVHCCHGTRLRSLLSFDQLQGVLSPILEHLDAPAPKAARCVIDRNKRLSLLRVQPMLRDSQELDLNRELGRLQSFVESDGFRTWAYLAANGGFSISYLVFDRGQAKELALWAERRPLVSCLLKHASSVPLLTQAVNLRLQGPTGPSLR